MSRNPEAYVDGIIVKTRERDTLTANLEETFANLQKANIKLNPNKCVFVVPSRKLLGFLVSHQGIEANPEKFRALEEMHHQIASRTCNSWRGALSRWGDSSPI